MNDINALRNAVNEHEDFLYKVAPKLVKIVDTDIQTITGALNILTRFTTSCDDSKVDRVKTIHAKDGLIIDNWTIISGNYGHLKKMPLA